ncbi:MAG: phosphocholine cytidylyltransferase family protein [Candidatus Aminicenantes bacterium]|nr:phosphocholine cytidylyltransferase family protein [Candidatus Aminicenantes bacterium]
MKALILASGTAQRLKPLTERIPKCLVKVNGDSILDRLLNQFSQAGIDDVVITTGPFEDKIKAAVKSYSEKLNITLVKNEIYDQTNYIYSIFRAKAELNDDILLAHGDLVFEDHVLTRLLSAKQRNVVVVRKNYRPPKDFKAQIKDNRVLKISTKIDGPDTHFLAPLYRFYKEDFQLWLDKIIEFVNKKNVHCYAEDALNELLPCHIELNPLYITGEICLEIDDFDDLKEGKKLLSAK